MSKTPFVIHEHVRWGDVDFAGIIRYDAYTRFMELAESELFRSIGVPQRAFKDRLGFGIPRRSMHIDFLSSPTLDERLTVVSCVSHVGRTSLTLHFDFTGEVGLLRASGSLVVVCVPNGATRGQPWPPEFLELIEPYCMTVDEARAGTT